MPAGPELADTPNQGVMKNYPLLIDFQWTLFGRGFVAEVSAHSRVLAVQESVNKWWFYGVNPGAVAASGNSLGDADADFREALQAILIQFASEALSFDAFRDEFERFFRATNKPTEAEWTEAVRATHEELEGLPVKPAEVPPSVTVTARQAFETFTPTDNIMRTDTALAKAA